MLSENPASQALGHTRFGDHMVHAGAATGGAYQFPEAASFRISFSSVRSETARRSRVQMKWSPVYDAYAKLIAKGEKLPNVNEGGYDKDLVKSTPFGAGASAALAAIDEMKAGKPIFVGGLETTKAT
jgi:hypothetical protein